MGNKELVNSLKLLIQYFNHRDFYHIFYSPFINKTTDVQYLFHKAGFHSTCTFPPDFLLGNWSEQVLILHLQKGIIQLDQSERGEVTGAEMSVKKPLHISLFSLCLAS